MECGAVLFKIITLLLAFMVSVGRSIVCDKMEIIRGGHKYNWTYSEGIETNYVISQPHCFDEDSRFVIARCLTDSGVWLIDNMKCVNTHRNSICPEDLIEIPTNLSSKPLCVKISNKAVGWSDRLCLGSDATIFDLNDNERDAIYEYLRSLKQIRAFWIPVQKVDGNVSNPFIWKIPGENWGDPLTKVEYIRLPDKNCLIANVSPLTVPSFEMRSCKELYHAVCVFKRENLAIKSACPRNYAAMMYEPNNCYGVEERRAYIEIMVIREYLYNQNKIRQILKTIDYSGDFFPSSKFYSGEGYYSMKNAKLTFKPRFYNKSLKYLQIRVMKARGSQVKMFLKFYPELNIILLTVNNPIEIWRLDEKDHGIKCFANADYETMQSPKIKAINLKNLNQKKAMYELRLYEDGPRYYWCEAHSVYNFIFLQSNKIVATRTHKGHIFSTLFEMPCDSQKCQEDDDNSKQDLGKQAEKIMKNLINSLRKREISIDSVKVMNITSSKEDFQSVSVFCHILASLIYSSVDDNNGVISKEHGDAKKNIRDAMKIRNLLNDLLKLHNANSSSVNSIEFCFPEILPGISNNTWSAAILGKTTTTEKLCLDPDDLPVTRRCAGDQLHGAMWEKVESNQISCKPISPGHNTTITLLEIDESTRPITDPEKTMKDVKEIIRINIEHLIPADLFFLGRILGTIYSKVISLKSMENSSEVWNVTKTMISDLTSIYNNLMKANLDVLKASMGRNCTNILLDVFDRLVDEISSLDKSTMTGSSDGNDGTCHRDFCKIELQNKEIIEYKNNHYGTAAWITPNVIVSVLDPNVANITGLALGSYTSESDRDSFENIKLRFLYSNQSSEKLLEEFNIQMATFVPDILLDRLNGNKHPRVVIKYLIGDILFQEDRNISNKTVYDKIVAVSIPNNNQSLPELLPLIMRKHSDDKKTKERCQYWDYNTWAKDGIVFLKESCNDHNLVLYGSRHLTAFAYVIASTDSLKMITTDHRDPLNMITLIGCCLSLIGTIGIFITGVIFRKWREKTNSKILLHLSLAIALQMILFCFVNTENYTSHLIKNHLFSSCVALGASLQYLVLVQFVWMMIIACEQFKRYVKVIQKIPSDNFVIKYSLIAWGVPLIPVLLVILLYRELYIPPEISGLAICYPTGRALYLGVCLPIAIVIVWNLAIFIKIVYTIVNRPNITVGRNKKGHTRTNIRVSVILFFLLGFSWIFGFLTFNNHGLIFSYLFSITATLQGFVIFVYFILLDPVTRKMWRDYLYSRCGV